MEDNSTTTNTDGTTLFAGDAWFDPIEAGIRDRVRGFIEELLEQELTAALGGRSKHERAVEHHQGYRNGTRERHAPDALHDEVSADYTDMIYAATAAEVQQRRRAFLRKWRLRCPAVATSL